MSSILLSANWTNLLVANFETDKKFLEQFTPAGTEANDWNGKYIMSLVGFEFSKPKFFSIPSLIYRSFPELNLRFYVKRKVKDEWRKGVVFIKEIAPAKLIGLVAGWLYKENFMSLPLKKEIIAIDDKLKINYSLKINNEINCLSAIVNDRPAEYSSETLEAFIVVHYWAYTKLNEKRTNEFRVIHEPWHIHPVISSEIKINAEYLYGKEFEPWLNKPPFNVFLMDGSETKVTRPVRL